MIGRDRFATAKTEISYYVMQRVKFHKNEIQENNFSQWKKCPGLARDLLFIIVGVVLCDRRAYIRTRTEHSECQNATI